MKKLILIFSALFVSSSAYSKTSDCKDCVEGSKTLLQKLRSDQIVNMETEILSKVCQTLEDPKGCMKGVEQWWPKIADVIFTDQAAPAICNQVACLIFQIRWVRICTDVKLQKSFSIDSIGFSPKWNCDDCQKDIKAFAMVGSSKDAALLTIETLSGKAFCQNPDYKLTDDQVKVCQSYVQAFMPAALKVLFGQVSVASQDICHFTFDGICPEMS